MNPPKNGLVALFTRAKMHQAVDGDGPVTSYCFLGQTIGPRCLASILGIGSNRLKRGISVAPDLRIGKPKSGSRSMSYSVDSFLSTMWQSVAETLPDRCIWVQ
jgi:hypothetical protein